MVSTENHWITISASLRVIADSIDLSRLEQLLGMQHTKQVVKSFLTRDLLTNSLVI